MLYKIYLLHDDTDNIRQLILSFFTVKINSTALSENQQHKFLKRNDTLQTWGTWDNDLDQYGGRLNVLKRKNRP